MLCQIMAPLCEVCNARFGLKQSRTSRCYARAMTTPKIAMTFAVLMLATGCADTHAPSPADANSSAPPPQPEPVALDTSRHFARCGGELADLGDTLGPIVADLVAQKIPYSRKPANEWRDCSGNFLRLSSALAAACPEHATALIAPPGVAPYVAGGDNAVPFDVPYRSSRSVAKWYHDQGRFVPVYYDDAPNETDVPAQLLEQRALIRPGAVVWFSRGRPVSADGIGALFQKTGSGSHINHMATVTEVTRDAAGDVISYRMFHGHGRAEKGTPSSVTNRQFLVWPERLLAGGTRSYPPLGYWSQRLVGVGTLVPTVTEALTGELPN